MTAARSFTLAALTLTALALAFPYPPLQVGAVCVVMLGAAVKA